MSKLGDLARRITGRGEADKPKAQAEGGRAAKAPSGSAEEHLAKRTNRRDNRRARKARKK